jgi:hypothetical protein
VHTFVLLVFFVVVANAGINFKKEHREQVGVNCICASVLRDKALNVA